MNDQFTLITWPEIQDYMDKQGFKENFYLIYGSSAYFINSEWLKSVRKKDFVGNTLVIILINMKNVFVPTGLQDAFLMKCQEDGINVNGGALKLEDGNVVGKYYYIS